MVPDKSSQYLRGSVVGGEKEKSGEGELCGGVVYLKGSSVKEIP